MSKTVDVSLTESGSKVSGSVQYKDEQILRVGHSDLTAGRFQNFYQKGSIGAIFFYIVNHTSHCFI